ncbi:MAG TPA: DUF362 domain-containing protein [Candidatus Acidoferrum sp.]|nr:DUF362 domain-containing protein [Candidatus Acidoferrum sp.]
MAIVSVKKNFHYDEDELYAAAKAHFDAFGGIERYVHPGDRVFIKVNMLMGRKPEAATTTHPALVYAVSKLAREAGCSVVIGDSPGGPYTRAVLERGYRLCGFDEAAKRSDAALNTDITAKMQSYPQGAICKGFNLITPWHEADCHISLCKCKTHAMTGFTGAVKNNFGLIPGLEKPEFHMRYPDVEAFCTMLVDLCQCASPDFTIMDAVVCMEGDGPSGGSPRQVGLTIASDNPFALDAIAVKAIGFTPDEALTVRKSMQMGACPGVIETVGDEVTMPAVEDFKRAKSHDVTPTRSLPGFIRRPIDRMAQPHPVVMRDKCVGCGECAMSCPAKTIKIIDGKASIDRTNCIRCFCCQEMCRPKAIKIKKLRLFSL